MVLMRSYVADMPTDEYQAVAFVLYCIQFFVAVAFSEDIIASIDRIKEDEEETGAVVIQPPDR